MSVDPEFNQTLDAYGYADDNPLDGTDWSGLSSCTSFNFMTCGSNTGSAATANAPNGAGQSTTAVATKYVTASVTKELQGIALTEYTGQALTSSQRAFQADESLCEYDPGDCMAADALAMGESTKQASTLAKNLCSENGYYCDQGAVVSDPIGNGLIGAIVTGLVTWGLGTIVDAVAAAGEEAAGEGLSQIAANKAAGDAARDAIAAQNADSATEVTFQTTLGARRVDVLTQSRLAIESKVGYVSGTKYLGQIAKDAELVQNGDVSGAQWVFTASSVTGRVGPSATVAEALDKAGIPWMVLP